MSGHSHTETPFKLVLHAPSQQASYMEESYPGKFTELAITLGYD
jgi:hypothetical protein